MYKRQSSGLLTSTAFSGSGASLTALNASNISSGTIAAGRVATLNQDTTGSSGSCTGNAATATTATNVSGNSQSAITSLGTLTSLTINGATTFNKEIVENVFAITDASSVALDPANGTIQTWTLGANRTATDSLAAGESLLLMVTAGANSLTWPTMTWSGGAAPTLSSSGKTAVELWKVGSTLYGATIGDL